MSRWTRRNKRVTLRWIFAVLTLMALMALGPGCSPQPQADDGSPDEVRVQHYKPGGRYGERVCLIFTHDTAQGASIAVVC